MNPQNRNLIQELSGIIQRITELSPLQSRKTVPDESNSRGLRLLAKDLRDELLKVTRTSRALADEAPQLRSWFRMPRSPGYDALRRAASAFIENTAPEILNLFIQTELPPDYLQVISQKLQLLESALAKRSAIRTGRTSVTTELGASLARGMVVLRKLDAAYRNKETDLASLEAWRIARNIELLHRPIPKYRVKGTSFASPELNRAELPNWEAMVPGESGAATEVIGERADPEEVAIALKSEQIEQKKSIKRGAELSQRPRQEDFFGALNP